MIKIDWKPSDTKLRQFGWICLAGFGAFGWMSYMKSGNLTVAVLLWGLAVVAPVIATLNPRLLKPLYWVLTALTLPIGFVVGNLMLAALFVLVFVPVALLFRLLGRDELRLRLDHKASSYWLKYPPGARQPASYYRTF